MFFSCRFRCMAPQNWPKLISDPSQVDKYDVDKSVGILLQGIKMRMDHENITRDLFNVCINYRRRKEFDFTDGNSYMCYKTGLC